MARIRWFSLFKPLFFFWEISFASSSPLGNLIVFLQISLNSLSFPKFLSSNAFLRFPFSPSRKSYFCNSGYQPCQQSGLRRTCLYPPVRKPWPIVATPVVIRPPKYSHWHFYFCFAVYDKHDSAVFRGTLAFSAVIVACALCATSPFLLA